jgi:hypothetical protein
VASVDALLYLQRQQRQENHGKAERMVERVVERDIPAVVFGVVVGGVCMVSG